MSRAPAGSEQDRHGRAPSWLLGLAVALAWSGGVGLPALPGPWAGSLAVALVVVAVIAVRGSVQAWPTTVTATVTATAPIRRRARTLALALLLVLLARMTARVLIAAPAVVPAALILLPGLLGIRRLAAPRSRAVATVGLAIATLAAALVGVQIEANFVGARGLARAGPIIGIHPRQAVAVRIDGYGPHDLVIDDFVEPDRRRGYGPETLAARMQIELRAIGERQYGDGPARAREAFSKAEVAVIDGQVAPAEREAYAHGFTAGLEVRSGTTGAGSSLEFVCPGRTLDPRPFVPRADPPRSCPHKYLIDGSSGLGLSRRWAGYSEARGGDRLRLARALPADARSLGALELGVLLLLVVALILLAAILDRRRPIERGPPPRSLAPGIAAALAGLALLASSPQPTSSAGHAGGTAIVALLLAIVSTILPRAAPPRGLGIAAVLRAAGQLDAGAVPAARGETQHDASLHHGLLAVGAIALVAASPLAGHGDLLALLAQLRDALVLTGGISWALAGAGAATVALWVLTPALLDLGVALIERPETIDPTQTREGRHGSAGWPVIALVLGLALALALRKPGDDLALLQGAAALLLASAAIPARLRARIPWALALAAAAALPWLSGAGDLVAVGAQAALVLLTAAVAAWPGPRAHA